MNLRNLEKKGWESHYIEKTHHLLKKAKENKPEHIKRLDLFFMWFVLIIILLGSCVVMIGIIPVMVATPAWFSYSILSIIGLCFGYLVGHFILEYEIKSHHFLAFALLVPFSAFATITVAYRIAQSLLGDVGITFTYDPWALTIIYTVAFSLPHVLMRKR